MEALLPADFEIKIKGAVKKFWTTRGESSGVGQEGGRGAVISGKNMNGFLNLVKEVTKYNGFPESIVMTQKKCVVLPGYYRASKEWDVLVISEGKLIAVFEFKSQVGSFGNNFNNRSEEVIGSAADLWVAHRCGAYNPEMEKMTRPPLLCWIMLLEDCEDSRGPVNHKEPFFKVLPEFAETSYSQRYRILCEKLMSEKLYGAAALVLSDRKGGRKKGDYHSLSKQTSVRRLYADYAARLKTEAE